VRGWRACPVKDPPIKLTAGEEEERALLAEEAAEALRAPARKDDGSPRAQDEEPSPLPDSFAVVHSCTTVVAGLAHRGDDQRDEGGDEHGTVDDPAPPHAKLEQ